MIDDIAKEAIAYVNEQIDDLKQQKLLGILTDLGNELKETSKFVYTYYKIAENGKKVADYTGALLTKYLEVVKNYIKKCDAKSCLTFGADYTKFLEEIEYSLAKYVHTTIKISFATLESIKMPQLPKYVFGSNFFEIELPAWDIDIDRLNIIVRNFVKKFIGGLSSMKKDIMEDVFKTIEDAKNSFAPLRDELKVLFQSNKDLSELISQLSKEYANKLMAQITKLTDNLMKDLKSNIKISQKWMETTSKMIINKYMKFCSKGALDDIWTTLNNLMKSSMTMTKAWTKQFKSLAAKLQNETNKGYKNLLSNLGKLKQDMSKMMDKTRKLAIQLYMDLYKGKPILEIVAPYITQFIKLYEKYFQSAKELLDDLLKWINPKTKEALKDYYKKHSSFLNKYLSIGRFYMDLAIFIATRTHRIAFEEIGLNSKLPVANNPAAAVGAYLGNGHVITYDGRSEKLPLNLKGKCSYILAADKRQQDFSVMAEEEALTIRTNDMLITVKKNEPVISRVTVNKKDKVIYDLPVQGESGWCRQSGRIIECDFESKQYRLMIDLDSFVTVISTSHWNYGESVGLLGTNNEEIYDDASINGDQNVVKFVNKYQVSNDKKCIVEPKKPSKPACDSKPSPRCDELFKDEDSPLKSLFINTDPTPFFKACQQKTADCANKENTATQHCGIVSAYILKSEQRIGLYHSFTVPECSTYTQNGKSFNIGDKFAQRPQKEIDIVIMISETQSIKSRLNHITKVIEQLQGSLAEWSTRFALIGFGGAKIQEGAHIQTSNGRVFTNQIANLMRTIKNMEYTGSETTSNDVYDAISYAGFLSYRPAASRLVLLFNADAYKPNPARGLAPTRHEAIFSLKYEANATLIAFDDVTFKQLDGQKSTVIGQTSREMYRVDAGKMQPFVVSDREMFPASSLTDLIISSDGAIFTIKLDKYAKQVSLMLKRFTMDAVKIQKSQCRNCNVRPSVCSRNVPCVASPARAQCNTDLFIKCAK